MEIDILNELLSESVAKLFNPRAVYNFKKPNPVYDNYQKNSNNTSSSSISSMQSDQPKFEQPQQKLSNPPTIEQWVNIIGPQKLQESLTKLNIDLAKLTKRDLELMSMDQLQNEKKRVKNELKFYDANFQSIFNRFPLRNEKEPMRPLYIYYKKLKQQIDKQSTNNTQGEIQKRIEDLKKTRAELREKLNNFQNEFTTTHNRRIRFHKDIAPVEKEYKLYKEIKNEIQKLENILQKK
ncbi:unnamed protein product (macronuclear) [Paramecium tetraurelia]|uniref:FAM13A-like domain-containing protein n=1 Tax=Paramecium tetraurelia TaxID=5888 RepID=A0BX67_PARTE|nr:uncharacterized protein GSPATT00032987001 [Paramecium tetraurelia]CAK63134.1 unnamed protein product [Paramecium tetraurelia]|eukprot:XP_001430532.1 hypothetical protein (macronuclear) [Paramecium tetraurelia strain d4-2]